MPNQKGSLKDRLRSWILFLNYKLKLKKKEHEEKKKEKLQKKQKQILASGKYYSKPKIFGLTALGLFFGVFEGKATKKIKTLEQKVYTLEKKIENNLLDKNIFQEIKTIENEITVIKNSNQNNNNIVIIETKLNNIKNKIKNESSMNNAKLENNNIKNENLLYNNSLEKEYKLNSVDLKKNGAYIPVLELKVFNKDLKKHIKNLQEINANINSTTEYDDLYEYEFLVKQLKLKINDLLNKYENLKNVSGFMALEDMISVKDFDEFLLRKDNKKINDAINWCEDTLNSIENKKKDLLSKQITTKVQKKEEKKESVKEEKKEKQLEEKTRKKIPELLLANKIIFDGILREKKKIARFRRTVLAINVTQRRHSVFYYTKNLISSIVNFSFSLFPLSLFKNKILGGLVSGIMINNSLRSVRKILKPDIEISYIYANIENEIASASNYLNKMVTVCNDSLNQIDEIRNIIYSNYGNDVNYSEALIGYLEDLSKIESKIKYEQATLLDMNEDLQMIGKRNKQKVKVIDRY